MGVEYLFGSSGESDDGAEGVDSEFLYLSLSTIGITDSTDSTYFQSQSSKINKGVGGSTPRCHFRQEFVLGRQYISFLPSYSILK